MSISETKSDSNEYYMGEEFCYRRTNSFDEEIRHFGFNLDEDIDKQMCFIKEYNINGLSFNGKKSFAHTKEGDFEEPYLLALDIVEKLNHRLLSLNLQHFEKLESLDILNFAPNLRQLSLHCILKKAFDFTKLPRLENLELWYGKKFSSIFECTNIKHLEIFKMDEYAAENIQNLYQLEQLYIRQTSIKSIDGLRNLSNLKRLELMRLPKLESISSIQECKDINELLFQNCKKVTDWEIISKLSNLKNLTLENCGTLNDISFLKPLENLESAAFIGEKANMNILDGKVRWLYETPKIKRVRIPWQNHFDISREEVSAYNTWAFLSQP